MRELTAFVREVVLPGGPHAVPVLDPACCGFRLRYGRSPIHRWGIFADEPIPAGRRVIEYTGERIDDREWARRSVREHLYFFVLDDEWTIDGAIGGSGAEFVNHACEPNLDAEITGGRIFLVSLRKIAPGEELTLDYELDGHGPEMPCACGSSRCRGRIDRPAGETHRPQTA